jgi:mannitol-specific phosphotransferase system IIBC component
MKTIINIFVTVVIGVLIFNYFKGDEKQKVQSKEVYAATKTAWNDIEAIISNEKNKYKAGKYDTAIEKLDSIVKSEKTSSGALITDTEKAKLNDIDVKIEQLKSAYKVLDQVNTMKKDTSKLGNLNAQLEKLVLEAKTILK